MLLISKRKSVITRCSRICNRCLRLMAYTLLIIMLMRNSTMRTSLKFFFFPLIEQDWKRQLTNDIPMSQFFIGFFQYRNFVFHVLNNSL